MMSTPLLKLENTNTQELLELIHQLEYTVEKKDSEPIVENGIQFWRLIFRKQAAQAVGCIIIQPKYPDDTFINISIDLRRIWKIWKIRSDQKLVLALMDFLVENGGVIVDEN